MFFESYNNTFNWDYAYMQQYYQKQMMQNYYESMVSFAPNALSNF